jgi:glyoxylase-like metal-dependent hydrolase (beta-lactamase superfamily II)
MITEIQQDFYRITLRMPYRLRHVNAYLLAHGKELALFDTGLNAPGALETLAEDLKSIGFHVGCIKHIYLTHMHSDHCSMAGVLQKQSDAQIHLSPAAFAEYEHYRNADPAINQLRKFYARHGMTARHIDLVIEEFESIRGIITEFNTEHFLRSGDLQRFGDWAFQSIFTPGHSFGHVCFFFPEKGWLISGDHVLPYIAPILSPNIFDDDDRTLKSYLESFDALENLAVSLVLPGHGSYFTDLKERLADIRDHHAQKKDAVANHVNQQPKTVFEISGSITAPTLSDFDKFLGLNETLIYLKELAAEGAIKENYNGSVFTYTKG